MPRNPETEKERKKGGKRWKEEGKGRKRGKKKKRKRLKDGEKERGKRGKGEYQIGTKEQEHSLSHTFPFNGRSDEQVPFCKNPINVQSDLYRVNILK